MTAPEREDLVQEVERPAEPERSGCAAIPDEECDAHPDCEGCPAKPPARLGRRA